MIHILGIWAQILSFETIKCTKILTNAVNHVSMLQRCVNYVYTLDHIPKRCSCHLPNTFDTYIVKIVLTDAIMSVNTNLYTVERFYVGLAWYLIAVKSAYFLTSASCCQHCQQPIQDCVSAAVLFALSGFALSDMMQIPVTVLSNESQYRCHF